jgi:DNA invertase Pin-like site-specific DNA recombinase
MTEIIEGEVGQPRLLQDALKDLANLVHCEDVPGVIREEPQGCPSMRHRFDVQQDLVAFLNELHSKHANLYLHKQGIDTTTPGGKLLFQMLGVFAEFERSMIVERVKAGLKRARAEGKVLGRPRVSAAVEAKVRALRGKGEGMRKIARTLGIGNCTVQRIVNA